MERSIGYPKRQLSFWFGDEAAQTALLADAIALREAIYRIFGALAHGQELRNRDVSAFCAALAAAPPRNHLQRLSKGFAWQIAPSEATAASLLTPVLWSAGDLLVKGEHARIRQCANEKCLWLFLDESKNATRRWCDMNSCGNRAKAQRHYQRRKRR
jgi:predicted RNA-binding Zn ribbon-like protein